MLLTVSQLTTKQLDTMHSWVTRKMQFNRWYPMESDAAYDAIIQLIDEGTIINVEFDPKHLHCRKIDLSVYKLTKREKAYRDDIRAKHQSNSK